MDLPPALDRRGASTAPSPESEESRELVELRAANRASCAADAARVRCVARLAERCRADVRERVSGLGESQLDVDAEEFAEKCAVDAVTCALGVSKGEAAALVNLASRLTVLPRVLDAWSTGVLDAGRVRVLVRATEVLDDVTARRVVDSLLPSAGIGPWDGPSPRTWRARVEETVVRADRSAAERRRAAARAARRVQAWAEEDGTGVLQLRADGADIALADQVVTDLARAWPARDPGGQLLSMDQRRADALMGVFRAIRDGSLAQYPDPAMAAGSAFVPAAGSAFSASPDGDAWVQLPRVPVRRVHDLGLVLHADTLYGDGPAADDTAQLRGIGRPAVVDPASAQTLARQQLRDGTAVQVLVVDRSGALQHVVRLDRGATEHCRSRATLVAAVRAALTSAPSLSTGGHDPTEAIARHVRAEAPTCSFYDCPRRARSCDLDHDTPWPRGPTSVTNLDPKCRRHHNAKTLGAVRTALTAGPGAGRRSVRWTLPAGVEVTTTPEPLPGT